MSAISAPSTGSPHHARVLPRLKYAVLKRDRPRLHPLRRAEKGDLLPLAHRLDRLWQRDAPPALQRFQPRDLGKVRARIVAGNAAPYERFQTGAGKDGRGQIDGNERCAALRFNGRPRERSQERVVLRRARGILHEVLRSPRRDLLQRGKDGATQAVAREPLVRIRLVLRKGERVLGGVRVDLGARRVQKRTDDPLSRGKDVQPRRRRSARKAEEHRFGGVVHVVRRRHRIRRALVEDALKTGVAELPPRLFQPRSVLPRKRGNVGAEHAERHAPIVAEFPDERKVCKRSRAADPVFAGERGDRHLLFRRVG